MADKMSMCPEHMMKQCGNESGGASREKQKAAGVTGPPQGKGAREPAMQPKSDQNMRFGNKSFRGGRRG